MVIFFGSLIYNEIIVIPVFGMDRNTKEEIKKRSEMEALLIDYKGSNNEDSRVSDGSSTKKSSDI